MNEHMFEIILGEMLDEQKQTNKLLKEQVFELKGLAARVKAFEEKEVKVEVGLEPVKEDLRSSLNTTNYEIQNFLSKNVTFLDKRYVEIHKQTNEEIGEKMSKIIAIVEVLPKSATGGMLALSI